MANWHLTLKRSGLFCMNDREKNKHAVALGRLGGRVGGKSRSRIKVSASKSNGKLGGRPKKMVDLHTKLSFGSC